MGTRIQNRKGGHKVKSNAKKNWKILQAIEKKNMRLFQFAEEIGMNNSSFNRSINGLRPFSRDEMRRISKALRIPQKTLFTNK